VREPAVVAALIKALDDPEALARYHAARGLLAIHGLPGQSNDREHMMYRVMSDDSARRDSGKRDILAAIAARPLSARYSG
jgi:HEAT repeat protein